MENTISIWGLFWNLFNSKEKNKWWDKLTPEEAQILKYLSTKEKPEHAPNIACGTNLVLSRVYASVKTLLEKSLIHEDKKEIRRENETFTQLLYTISIIGKRVAEKLPEQED